MVPHNKQSEDGVVPVGNSDLAAGRAERSPQGSKP
jgi:hypothetical protein